MHVAVAGLGHPVPFVLTAGQEADVTQGPAWRAGHRPEAGIAAKGFDRDGFVAPIAACGAQAVIPPRKNRVCQRE